MGTSIPPSSEDCPQVPGRSPRLAAGAAQPRPSAAPAAYDPRVATRARAKQTAAELRARVAELERERVLLNAIANHAPSMLCLVDADGCVRPFATNRAFERTLGYDPKETGGVHFWERYVPPEDADEVRAAIDAAIAGREGREHDGRWLTRAGDVVHVLWSCTPLPEFATGPAWLISATDIGDRKRHEEEVRRSRARIVAAADEARKRLERNLHDGAQQRLMSLLLFLRLARSKAADDPSVAELLDQAVEELSAAVTELRELARGIHPEVLSRRGLGAALRVMAARQPTAVDLEVPKERYGETVEAAAYYVVSEALANVAKYAQASAVSVRVAAEGGRLVVAIEDDGVGDADAVRGTGLRGLEDRVAALDGTFKVDSPAGRGTRVHAELPLD
jgi:PAS domain S-box-containing protein